MMGWIRLLWRIFPRTLYAFHDKVWHRASLTAFDRAIYALEKKTKGKALTYIKLARNAELKIVEMGKE